jgi:capsular exopolysaccharide synthesis family protein
MTIIERALNKHRSVTKADMGVRKRTAPPVQAIDPALRIPRSEVQIDRDFCRQRRLLVSTDNDRDKGYVAAYRMLRTRLLQKARTANWMVIAVTSAGPNDGKTLTAINLALSLAREKTREIVLLDMDMRNPSVCRALGVQPAAELSDFLEHGTHLEKLFFTIGSDNLLLAGAVTPIEHASEVLAGPRFEELMSFIKHGAMDPIVLIDLPPVLVTDDALVVAPKVDAVLVVASEGHTSRADLGKALDMLSEFPVAGVVLNRSAESSPYYNYGYEADSSSRVSRKQV